MTRFAVNDTEKKLLYRSGMDRVTQKPHGKRHLSSLDFRFINYLLVAYLHTPNPRIIHRDTTPKG
ncbi:hypothetical protein E2C01_028361 [Portunus trituberculatus]|uniref:Uncharacterized protein n=1 Tax=Portunus trituberculatus TaxID=210409 RepID=A0A5B7ENU1_PORTR|nr:hypothetical protein [Portunus trituberculatus]